jgi:replicative DNA helicase Mcm
MVDIIDFGGEDKILPLKVMFEDKSFHRNYDSGDLELNLDLLKENHIELFEFFNDNPQDFIKIAKKSIKEALELFPARYNKQGALLEASTLPKNILNFKIINFPKGIAIPIAHLRSEHLNSLVMIKGIIKMMVSATSKIESILYECTSCNNTIKIEQEDANTKKPSRCNCGGRNFVLIKEDYRNIQEMEVEENVGEIGSRQPQKVRLLLRDNLTDPEFNRFQVGNKVEVIGILNKMPKYISGKEKDSVVINYLIDVIAIHSPDNIDSDIYLSEEDIKKIREISLNNPLQILSENLAPTIDGLDFLKKSIILFLAKGVTKKTDFERRRGEIHILVVSDPGLAKSTLAQNIHKKIPNCRMADGKGSSKAGLLYGVVKDNISGKWGIEAGDMVLANGGYLILDEFEKISAEDREGIHTPMEQGVVRVSMISKASLQAETSILGLANPRASSFDLSIPMINQIDLPSSLMSRFDLIFAIKDEINEDIDKNRALKIMKVHRKEIVSNFDGELFKKYFFYCSKLVPTLPEHIDQRISDLYSKLRNLSVLNGKRVGLPVNQRHIEALIRLSEAHAKLRLSSVVEDIDVDVAEELFITSLNQFGYDADAKIYDLSRITTKIRPTKKDKYYAGLDLLKNLSKINNELKTEDLIEEFKNKLSLSYGEAMELIELFHRQNDIYESSSNIFKLNSKNL